MAEDSSILKEYVFPDSPDIFLSKVDQTFESFGKRDGAYIHWLKETYDDRKYEPYEDDLSTGHPTINRALLDLDHGIALIAGKPNFGKSTLLANIITQGLELTPELIVLDLTFDDSGKTRVEQYLCAMTSLTYSQVKLGVGLTQTQQTLLTMAKDKLKEFISEGRLRIYDSVEYLPDGSVLRLRHFDTLLRAIYSAKNKYPNSKIVVVVDSWSDLETTDGKGSNETTQANYWLSKLHEVINQTKVILLATCQLVKFEGTIPTIDDIKGTSNLAFEARAIYALINEQRAQHFVDPITYNYEGKTYPAIMLRAIKNKVSEWDGDIFYGLIKNRCKLIPVTLPEYKELAVKISTKKREVFQHAK